MSLALGRTTERRALGRFGSKDKPCGWLLVLLFLVGCGDSRTEQPPPIANVDPIMSARQALEAGDVASASESIAKALIESPEDDGARLLAARIEFAKGDLDSARQIAESIPASATESAAATELLVAWMIEDRDLEAAVDRLQWSLKQQKVSEETTVRWVRGLWDLLSRLGRRQEASFYADQLCRVGRYDRDLLTSLLRRGESYPITTKQPAEKRFAPGHGVARWLFSQEKFAEAADEMSRDQSGPSGAAAARAFRGRLLAETQAFEQFPEWFAECDKPTRRFADYWMALGIWFYQQQQMEASARALAEAVYLDPTDDDACHRLARVLSALNRKQDAIFVREHAIRVALLRELAFGLANQNVPADALEALPEQLLTLGRPFESIGWALETLKPGEAMKRTLLIEQHAALQQNRMTVHMASELALTDIDRQDFAIESAMRELAKVARTQPQPNAPESTPTLPAEMVQVDLQNVADAFGLNFQWYHAEKMNLKSLPLHEMMGGGIGVLDYDLDGLPDVYLTQGSGDPPNGVSTRSNKLFRNVRGRFIDVTESTDAEDLNYSSGVAAGDINQDGFPDLFLGALGRNRLLINNGDGTFQDATDRLGEVSDQFTSSVAIADLNGDGIPDLFECVYVEMADGFRLPEKDRDGREIAPGPNDFYAEADRWWLGSASGDYELQAINRDQVEPGTALGVVVTDLDDDGRNDVFVSNDARPNHVLTGFDSQDVINRADGIGLGVGFRGISNSCMGIASADFNRDGKLDFHITNFINEPANHFLQLDRGIFGDEAGRYQLSQHTTPFTGFGVVAVDFGWDSWPDLVVANGHVFDARDRGLDFHMPTQVLLNLRDRFVDAEMSPESIPYFDGRYVGRSVATLDLDRDLDWDFVVGHLDAPTALLRNETIRTGNGIQLVLIGTSAERDAVGSRVQVITSAGTFTNWVTAGDGYLCSHENVIDIGLGDANAIDELSVRWISGRRQTFRNLNVNQRYLIIEGSDEVWPDIGISERHETSLKVPAS